MGKTLLGKATRLQTREYLLLLSVTSHGHVLLQMSLYHAQHVHLENTSQSTGHFYLRVVKVIRL